MDQSLYTNLIAGHPLGIYMIIGGGLLAFVFVIALFALFNWPFGKKSRRS